MSTDLLTNLTHTLIPDAKLAEAEQHIKELQHQLAVSKLNPPSPTRESVVWKVFEDARGKMPSDADLDAMYARLVDLVSDDEDDVWTPEQEYSVTLSFLVTVTGTIQAKSAEEAESRIYEDEPKLKLGHKGPLDWSADIDVSLDNVNVD